MDDDVLLQLKALQGRTNALEALTMTFAPILIKLLCDEDLGGTKMESFLAAIRKLVAGRVSQVPREHRLETERAVDDLLKAIRLRVGLNGSPSPLNA